MKKFIFLMLFTTVFWQHSLAQDFSVDGLNYNITSPTTVEVGDQGQAASGIVIIPPQVMYNLMTYSVTSIGSNAFSNCFGITSVTIPNSVTTIDNYAFFQCFGLTSVIIPNSVNTIGAVAFYNCANLTSVTMPNSVTSIGNYAFGNCSDLTAISIPDSVTSIGDNAFQYCTSLTTVTIPNSITSIGDYTFNNCVSLTSVTIPDSVNSIGYEAFRGCSGLTSISIPTSVTSIGNYAFAFCSALTLVTCNITSPLYINANVFGGLSQSACTLAVPAGSEADYESAPVWQNFSPIICNPTDNITAISSSCSYTWANNGQTYTVSGVYTGATANCLTEKLDLTITAPSSNFSSGGLNYTVTSPTTVAVSNNAGVSGAIVIPSSVTDGCNNYAVTLIGSSAFENCTGLTSVIIPDSVTSIGVDAFAFCSGLTAVSIPNSVISIATSSFSYCFGLTSITIPNSVTSIGNSAFNACFGLTSVTIPNSVTSIGYGAFFGCTGLTSISISNSLTSIENEIFYGCTSLTSITIPDSVIYIEINAFKNCSGLTSVTIPNSVTYIGEGAFYSCNSLTSVTCHISTPIYLPSNVFDGVNQGACTLFVPEASISAYQDASVWQNFNPIACIPTENITTIIACNSYDWNGITYTVSGIYTGTTINCVIEVLDLTITAPPTNFSSGGLNYMVTSPTTVAVGNNAGVSGAIVIPSSVTDGCNNYAVTSIGSSAFENCAGLTSVIIPDSVTSIGVAAFAFCSGLTAVSIPNTVNSIAANSFYFCSGLTSITIPNSVTSIGEYAFYFCSGLTSVTIPNSVSSIGFNAFSYCYNLTSVTIPNSVTSISDFAFFYCSGLTSVTIPSSVTSIGFGAFYSCFSLTSVICNIIAPLAIDQSVFDGVNQGACILIVPNASVSAYQAASVWQDFAPISCSNPTDNFTTVTACGSYTWNGIVYTTSGVYAGTTTNCVIEKLDLTINALPTFVAISPICTGENIALPTISDNGISGTWSPAINNTETTQYTFTSSTGECSVNMTIEVKPLPVILHPTSVTACEGEVVDFSVTAAFVSSPILLTQNVSSEPLSLSGIACTGANTENTYYRVFDLGALGYTSSFILDSIKFAVETSAVSRTVTVNAYTLNGVFNLANLSLLGSETIDISTDPLTVYTVNMGALTVPGGSILVLSYSVPGAPTEQSFFPGANTLGQTGPTFISASGCSVSEPADLALFGFSNNAIILEAVLTNVGTLVQTEGLPSGSVFPLGTTTVSYLATSTDNCSTTSSFDVTVNTPELPTFLTVAPICVGEALDALPTTSTNNIEGTWSPALNNLETTTYTFTPNVVSCATTAMMTINVNATPAPVASAQTLCNTALISNLVASGTDLQWYDSATSTVALAGTTNLATGNYFVSQTLNACESPRTMVAVTVNVTPTPTASAQTFCNVGTVADLVASGTDLQWYDYATSTVALSGTTNLATGDYYVSQTLNGCESSRMMIAITVNVTPAPTALAQTFCNVGTVADLVASGTDLQWYDYATSTVALAGTTNLATGNYFVSQTLNACESPRTMVAVTVNVTPTPTASAQTFCNIGTVADLMASGTDLQWYDSSTGGTALAGITNLATGNYFVSQTLNVCESPRTMVAVTLNITPAPTALAQTFCNTGTVADLIATGTDLQWYDSATGGTALAGTTNLATGNYFVSQTLNGCESPRTMVAVTVNVTPTPTASVQIFCNTGTVADLMATGTNLQWYDSSTGGTALAGTTNLATGNYFVSQTLNACESPRTMVVVTVNVTPTPTASAQTFCNVGTVADLVASGTDLQWYDSATVGTALAGTTNLATGNYFVSQTLNACESPRTMVAVTVNVTPTPTALAQTFCNTGTVADLIATGTDLQWYDSATSTVALAGTTNLATGNYFVSQTLNACESPRTMVAVTVNVTPTPTASLQTFCNTGTVADLMASGTDLQWYDSATGGTALAGTTNLATGNYFVSQTLNGCESPRMMVAVIVNVTPAPTASVQIFCTTGTVSDLVASGTDLQWYDSATSTVALAGTTVLTTGDYYVSQTLNACESPRTMVAVTVNVTPAPSQPAMAQTFCNVGTVADLVASGTDLQWYDSATGGTALAGTTNLATGNYFVSQTLNGCESPRSMVAVTLNVTPAPTALAQTFCNTGTVADLVASGTDLQWYADATGTIALAGTTVLTTGDYYVSQTLNACESPRTMVAVTVNVTPAPTASAQTFCNIGTVADLMATGTNLQWYDSATGGTALAGTINLATGNYFVSQTLNGCESPRTMVAVTLNITPAPTALAQTFCNVGTVADLMATGMDLKWYATATGGTALAGITNLATGNYFVSQTLNACESPRTMVAVVIGSTTAPTGVAIQDFTTGQTLADFTVVGQNIIWYSAATGASVLPATTLLVSGTIYYASQTVNGCESITRLAVTAGLNLKTPTFEISNLRYYPNPVQDILTVDYSDVIEGVQMYNMLGQMVYSKSTTTSKVTIGMGGMAAGSYILQVTVKGITKNVKVIKK